jgi:hypothetical protein
MERAGSSGLSQGDDFEMTILHSIKKILSALLICTGLGPVCSARTSEEARLKSLVLLNKYAETHDKLQ